MPHRVTLIPGDGIGPELSDATRRVLEATGVAFDWDVREAGADVMEKHGGNPLPDSVIESIARTGVAIKGPITTPVGTGFRSVNVALRKALDLFAQVRPCKSYAGVRSRYEDVDLVIVRENTEDLYAGIEFEEGTDNCAVLRDTIQKLSGAQIREDAGISIKPISIEGTRRVVQFALDYARREGRRKVTVVHKANIMKHTDGLWLRVAREVAEGYTDIEFEDRIVDNMCMQLVQKPELYDVMVLPNLYGDIVSDLGAGLVGGLGVAPGRELRPRGRAVRADARLRAQVRRPEQGQPDGDDALGRADAAPPRRARRRRPHGGRDRRRDRRGQGRHLRPQAAAGRPDRRRHLAVRRRGHRPACKPSTCLHRRAALAAAAFLAAAWLLGLGTLLPSSNRWFLVLLAPALVYRRGLLYVRDFAPFALAVLAYEWARTLAHRINPDPFYRPQIDVDKVIGLGRVPSVRLQGWLYDGTPGAVRGRAREGALVARRGAARRALPALARLAPRVRARRRGGARQRVRGGDRVPRLPRRAALAGRLPRPHRAARAHPRARPSVPARARATLAR